MLLPRLWQGIIVSLVSSDGPQPTESETTMNTSTHYVLPLYTVRNRRNEGAVWLNGTTFVTANRCSADDCALAFRRYTDDNVFGGNITGAWRVVEHSEPVRLSTHTRRVHAIRELNERKEDGIKREIRATATGFELWAIPQVRAFGDCFAPTI